MAAQLPTELLHLVFQNATPADLRTFRLVDRRCSSISKTYLFECVHTSLFSRSLAKLSAISQSSLAKHVKVITFHSDQLPVFSRQEWENKIDCRPDFRSFRASLSAGDADWDQAQWDQARCMHNALPRHSYTPAQLEAGWQAFQAHWDEQVQWVDGRSAVVLQDSASRLPNLREINVDRAKPFGGRVNEQPFWRNIRHDILIDPNTWTYSRSHSSPAELRSLATRLMVSAVGHRSVVGMQPVEKLSVDLSDNVSLHNTVHMSSRRASSGRASSREPLVVPIFATLKENLPQSSLHYETVVDAFRPLKHLVIRCPSTNKIALDIRDRESHVVEIDRFLSAATGLLSLDIDFGEPEHSGQHVGEDADERRWDLGIMPVLRRSSTTYPHLKTLRISAAFPCKLFNRFLALHKETLKRVDIRDCFNDDWYSVLETLARSLKLEYVYVESLWSLNDAEPLLAEGLNEDSDFARNMKIFLKTGEGEVPRLLNYIDLYAVEDEDLMMNGDPQPWDDPQYDFNGTISDYEYEDDYEEEWNELRVHEGPQVDGSHGFASSKHVVRKDI